MEIDKDLSEILNRLPVLSEEDILKINGKNGSVINPVEIALINTTANLFGIVVYSFGLCNGEKPSLIYATNCGCANNEALRISLEEITNYHIVEKIYSN